MAGPKRNCPSCNELAPTNIVETQNARELKCGFCGLTLDSGDRTKQFEGDTTSAAFKKSVAQAPQSFQTAPTQTSLKPLIHIAEDSRLIRSIVTSHLQTKYPNAEILASEDGKQSVETLTRALLPGRRRGVVIFDLQMPYLNGIAAAIALRAIEKALGYEPALPIIFFSAVKVNDQLKQAMTEATPASYLHKTDTENPENMLARLQEVMSISIKRVYT